MSKKPVPRNSRSKISIPSGFSPDREKSGRACFRCNHIIENFGDGPRRCTFKCRRIDFANPRFKYHQHQYKIPNADDEGFPKDYILRHKKAEFSEIQSAIINQVGKLAGELDISITKSSSESMKTFIEKILSLGIRIGITDSSLNPQDGFIQLSQPKVNNAMKSEAEAREEELEFDFQKNIKYVNLLMDTGTINKFKVLHFIIMNPNFSEEIWPYDNYENKDFDGDDYAEIIDEIMTKLIQSGIEPVSIIADQQSSQVKGICKIIKKGKSNLYKSLIHVPCISHMANLVYEEILALKEFHPYLQEIDELINFCRLNEIATQIGKMCPTLVKSRWVYLSEVLEFFEEFLEKINILRTGYELSKISPQIIEFCLILKPLKEFTYYSEKRETKLSEILPKMKETFDDLIKIKSCLKCDESKYVIRFVLATFLARMQTLPLNVIKTAFAISLQGRKFIREIASFNVKINYGDEEIFIDEEEEEENPEIENAQIQDSILTSNSQGPYDLQEYNENTPQTFEIPVECDLEDITEIEEVNKMISLEQAVEESQKLMSTQERHSEFIQSRDSLMNDPELEEYDWYQDLIPIAEETLERQAHLLQIENYQYLTQELRKWWFEKDLKGYIKIAENESTDSYWR